MDEQKCYKCPLLALQLLSTKLLNPLMFFVFRALLAKSDWRPLNISLLLGYEQSVCVKPIGSEFIKLQVGGHCSNVYSICFQVSNEKLTGDSPQVVINKVQDGGILFSPLGDMMSTKHDTPQVQAGWMFCNVDLH